jgi:hypothetical protein
MTTNGTVVMSIGPNAGSLALLLLHTFNCLNSTQGYSFGFHIQVILRSVFLRLVILISVILPSLCYIQGQNSLTLVLTTFFIYFISLPKGYIWP